MLQRRGLKPKLFLTSFRVSILNRCFIIYKLTICCEFFGFLFTSITFWLAATKNIGQLIQRCLTGNKSWIYRGTSPVTYAFGTWPRYPPELTTLPTIYVLWVTVQYHKRFDHWILLLRRFIIGIHFIHFETHRVRTVKIKDVRFPALFVSNGITSAIHTTLTISIYSLTASTRSARRTPSQRSVCRSVTLLLQPPLSK